MQDCTEIALGNREKEQGLGRQDLVEPRGQVTSWFPWEGMSGFLEKFSGLLEN